MSPRSETAAVAVDVREKVLKDVMFAVHDYSTGYRLSSASDMELGHWVNGSFGSSFTSGSPGHWVIILTRHETQVFPVFEKNAQNAKRTF